MSNSCNCGPDDGCSDCSKKPKVKKPPKWMYVYPQGTKEGDEEQRFFIALSRNAKYEWRSVSAVAKESGLTEKRVEEILSKYYSRGIVFQNPTNETLWGYWERVPKMLPKDDGTVTSKDQKKRVCDSMKAPSSMVTRDDGFIDLSCVSNAHGRYEEYEKLAAERVLFDKIVIPRFKKSMLRTSVGTN